MTCFTSPDASGNLLAASKFLVQKIYTWISNQIKSIFWLFLHKTIGCQIDWGCQTVTPDQLEFCTVGWKRLQKDPAKCMFIFSVHNLKLFQVFIVMEMRGLKHLCKFPLACFFFLSCQTSNSVEYFCQSLDRFIKI